MSSTADANILVYDVPDGAIVAMMTANGVSTIFTRNRGFRRFDGIRVIDPFRWID